MVVGMFGCSFAISVDIQTCRLGSWCFKVLPTFMSFWIGISHYCWVLCFSLVNMSSLMRFSWTCSQFACRFVGLRVRSNLIITTRSTCQLLKSRSSFLDVSLKRLTGAQPASVEDRSHSRGSTVKRKFRAETQKLLDIVAKSLYSEKEVSFFVLQFLSFSCRLLEIWVEGVHSTH